MCLLKQNVSSCHRADKCNSILISIFDQSHTSTENNVQKNQMIAVISQFSQKTVSKTEFYGHKMHNHIYD